MTKVVALFAASTFATMAFAATTPSDESARQCMIDVCGPEESYLALSARGPFGDLVPVEIKKFLDEQIDRRISELMDLSVQNLALRLNTTDTLIERARTDPLTREQKALLFVTLISSKISSDLTTAIESTKGFGLGFRINPEKARLQGFDEPTTRSLVTLLNAFLESPDVILADRIASFDFDLFKKFILRNIPAAEAGNAWLAALDEVQDLVPPLQQNFGPYVIQDLDLGLLKKAGSKDTLSEKEKKDFMTLLNQLYSYTGVLDKKVRAAMDQVSLPLPLFLERLDWSAKKAALQSLTNDPVKIQAAQKNAIKSCRATIVKSLAAAPTGFRLRHALELTEKVKAAARVAARQYLTGEALKSGLKAIDSVHFAPPEDGALKRDMILAELDQRIRRSREAQKMIATTTDDGKDSKSLLLTTLALAGVSKTDGHLEQNTLSACRGFKPTDFVDASFAILGEIQISWQTVDFPEIGAGVIAHEVGHIVSAAIKDLPGKDLYTQARACTSNKHDQLLTTPRLHSPDSQYDEEDWADAFAATTLKSLNVTWPYAKNFACALVPISDNQAFSALTLKAATALDKHSTGFYRTLQTHVNLGRGLPKSCEAALGTAAATLSNGCAK